MLQAALGWISLMNPGWENIKWKLAMGLLSTGYLRVFAAFKELFSIWHFKHKVSSSILQLQATDVFISNCKLQSGWLQDAFLVTFCCCKELSFVFQSWQVAGKGFLPALFR